LIRGNGIESHRKYIKLIRIIVLRDAEDEYEEENIFSVNVNVDVK